MTPTKDEEESSEEELSEEEYKQEYLRQEQLREKGITNFGKANTAKKLKGILKKGKTQTSLRPEWAQETQEMFISTQWASSSSSSSAQTKG